MLCCAQCYAVSDFPDNRCPTCSGSRVNLKARRLVRWLPATDTVPRSLAPPGTLVVEDTVTYVAFGFPGGRRISVRRDDIHFVETEPLK